MCENKLNIPDLTKLGANQISSPVEAVVRRAFKFRSITNEGLPAKFVVQLRKEGKIGSIVIKKTLFSSDNNYFGVKRKWKTVWYCEERIVLKLQTTLAIAIEVYKFLDERA